jgi:hypothetical protein
MNLETVKSDASNFLLEEGGANPTSLLQPSVEP